MPKLKQLKWKRILVYSTISLFSLLLFIGGYIIYQLFEASDNSYSELERSNSLSQQRKETVTIENDPISILLMGIENYSSGNKDGRADTQIVLTLNPDNKKITMTSIPRDTRVLINQIQEYTGYHKINAAYAFGSISGYGGANLTVQLVEDLLDIPIDKYISVDFEGFRDIVDTLGGVTVDIKEPFWEENIYTGEKIHFEKGEAHLDGEEALAFVRMRKRGVNDIYPREERQRQFIKATLEEAISTKNIFKVGEISDVIGDNVQTNFKPLEIYSLETSYSTMDTNQIETIEIEGEDKLLDNLYYFIPDQASLEGVKKQLKKELLINNESHLDE